MPESLTDTPLLTDRFQRAFALANEVHGRQLRKSTRIPYVSHLMSVAALVLEHGGGEDAAIGGLLHDTIEDSDDGTAIESRLRREFGDPVADIVRGCSDAIATPGSRKGAWRRRKEDYVEHVRRERNPDVLLVSACDKLHNARATVADLRTHGAEAWSRFSAGPADQLWLYGEMLGAYEGRVPAALSAELGRVVGEMRALAGSTAS